MLMSPLKYSTKASIMNIKNMTNGGGILWLHEANWNTASFRILRRFGLGARRIVGPCDDEMRWRGGV